MRTSTSHSATLLVVCVAHFLMPFMMSAVGVALPAMGREFNASAMQLGLVETTYVLSASIFLLAMGRAGDIHGRRKVFQFGVLFFTVTGGIISQAWSIEAVIALRFLQGMGGAMVMATSMAMVVSTFPPSERGKALGIAVASVYAGISCGPFIGGMLVAGLGWRSIFYLLAPLGLFTFFVARLKMHDEWAEAAGEPFDWVGLLIYGPSILLLVAGVSNLSRGPWAWGLLVAANIGFALFLWWETRCKHPILNIDLLRHNRVFALSNLAALFNYAATFGVTFFLSLYLQYVKGMGPHQAGTVLITQPIVQTLLSPFCGRLSDRVPASYVATSGMALCAVGLAFAANLSADSGLSHVLVLLVFLGAGFACFSSPNVSIIMGSVEPRDLGVASGMNSSMRTLGMMTSMMIITLVFSYLMHGQPVTAETQPDFLASMHWALLIFCALCVIGIGCSFGRFTRSPETR
ncbi:drug resistance transporter, EmrB/QacA subfamily [Malonomonas rubra DSM 5091]|uniref:Drug resistance transporter, EmrB/QacA subfamily n=1 Tax=Malonomonas rubra DSM 5091 TaxID=1122189 RepID=A0A1M6MPY1_MALRU|nr:MFS transporter [Malonomonas rubra]SHJ85538.1 drug resistance transporter, EmrB/QacA subfamily [Malonomonas rubra DSM 5091]